MDLDVELINVIYTLLPGFLAAWVFYGLTTHPRREIFERVVQALIFTGIVKVVTTCFAWALLRIGRLVSVGPWSPNVEFGWSMVFALALGVVVSYCANRDTIHKWLREGKWVKKYRITTKNSYPSEWFSAFQREERHVILHFKDGRRLMGWPEEWPNEPTGYFLITDPSWVLKDATPIPMPEIRRLVIDATLVNMVEQLFDDKDRKMTTEQIRSAQKPLLALHHKPRQEVSTNGEPEHTSGD